jgi:hypothetical protein
MNKVKKKHNNLKKDDRLNINIRSLFRIHRMYCEYPYIISLASLDLLKR